MQVLSLVQTFILVYVTLKMSGDESVLIYKAK